MLVLVNLAKPRIKQQLNAPRERRVARLLVSLPKLYVWFFSPACVGCARIRSELLEESLSVDDFREFFVKAC